MAGTNGHHSPPVEIPPLRFIVPDAPAPSTIIDEREERSAQWSGAELGEVLSPSQVNTFIDCPARWYFKYVRDLPDPKTGSLAVGSAFHAALKANFKHKLEHGTDLPIADALAAYGLAWHDLQERTTFSEKEDPAELGRLGEALVAVYLQQAAPAIVPVLLERRLSGVIGGVRTQGYVDLLDVNGVIIDSKSAARSPSGISASYALQLTTYSMLLPGHTGECRLDTVTKTKTVKFIPQMFHVGAAQRQYASSIYPMVRDSIRQGVYLPKR